MFSRCFLLIGALLSLAISVSVAIETCPATGMPGMPGIPGLPGKDGRDGEKGQKGEPGALWKGGSRPVKGEKGDTGPTGYPGKRGQSGEPGTVGIQQQAAFSVARGTTEYPDRNSVIRFTKVITNINNDYDTNTGRFRCRVPGMYYLIFHASLEDKLCVLMKLDSALLMSFCDHRHHKRQVTSGGLAVYLSRDQEVWLETKDYRGMTGKPNGYSVFSGFLLHPH
ncbi:complement C1q subcomponent subunit C-like [Xenentodon cancila]